MGEAIPRLKSAPTHRTFSQALAGFAGEARRTLNEHNGVLIYAGGDDALAFVPVDKCLRCARTVRTDCYVRMNLTLSVGVGI
jgi:CRISPR-associated protein Cmr2